MYRILLLSLLTISATLQLSAQNKCKTITTDIEERTICYFTSGQKSTETSFKKSDPHWHKFIAYSMTGTVIYEKEYGHKWGSSGVEVKYHPNGGLYSAHYTMQPDGGIQYYDVTTYFTAEGKYDHEEDMSRGNDGELHLKTTLTNPIKIEKTATQPNKPNECAPVPTACELYLINHTSDDIKLKAQYKKTPASPFGITIEPSDTIKVGSYTPYHPAENPLNHYALTIANKARNGFEYQVKPVTGNNSKQQYMIISLVRKKPKQK